ncbi:Phosphotransferase enzyme family [Legionella pneumophila]|uniref:phosphotransferase family protein n=1 Tax=Legionella pneumophila TaxID=446 RepID=UPI0007709A75|nr:aminoglycoside phosphotransferase family protein [Legionella pneumophila]CZH02724.1 Phosphotransferase enzyme family [Legionella pneumophila]
MNIPIPNEQIVSSVVHSMTGEWVLSVTRLATGDQNFVYAVKTTVAEYVLRMTTLNYKHKFHAAIAWQKILIPRGIPLAEFINSDLDGKYSPFPALLMRRLLGDDLINVYHALTNAEKKNLAKEMVNIQALCVGLPDGPGYGICDNYDVIPTEKTWYDFLSKRLDLYKEHITKNAVFNPDMATQTLNMASKMKENFSLIRPTPFLWDASERNVLVHNGNIVGIVDVDEICFGDPLLVIALTSTCLELEGLDTLYTDYWAAALHLDKSAQDRLNFYRLFYSIAFMRKHSMLTANSKKVMFDTQKLLSIFQQSWDRLNKLDV